VLSATGRPADVRSAVSARWPDLWAEMTKDELDALVVHGRGAVGQYGFFQYTTGAFPAPKGTYAVVGRDSGPVVVVPTAAEARALEDAVSPGVDLAVAEDGSRHGLLETIAAHARGPVAAGRVGLAAGGGLGLPAYDHRELLQLLDGADVVPAEDLLYRLKTRLAPEDVDGLREAVLVAEAGLDAFRTHARAGMTEWEAGAPIESELRRSGALTTLVHVASSPFVGQAPTGRRIEEGDVVTVIVELTSADGYWAEVGALFGCGDVSEERRHLVDACIRCLQECPGLLVPEAKVAAVAEQLTERVRECGGEPVVGLGHAVGIDEGRPVISTADNGTIRPGTAFSMHPSIGSSGSAYAVANTYVVDVASTCPLSDYPHEFRTFA
jgi:Xaa-Pro aminopeptidase